MADSLGSVDIGYLHRSTLDARNIRCFTRKAKQLLQLIEGVDFKRWSTRSKPEIWQFHMRVSSPYFNLQCRRTWRRQWRQL